MLYHLLFPLRDDFPLFNVFRYITFRTAGAIVTAILLALWLGPRFIATLRRLSVGQNIRDVGPQTHQVKAGTPTMGGLLILFALVVPTLLWANLANVYVWIAIGVTVSFGAIGFADDFLKAMKEARGEIADAARGGERREHEPRCAHGQKLPWTTRPPGTIDHAMGFSREGRGKTKSFTTPAPMAATPTAVDTTPAVRRVRAEEF